MAANVDRDLSPGTSDPPLFLTRELFQYPKRSLFVRSRSSKIISLNNHIALKFNMHLGSIAAEMHVMFQSDQTLLSTNLITLKFEVLPSDIETASTALPSTLKVLICWCFMKHRQCFIYVRVLPSFCITTPHTTFDLRWWLASLAPYYMSVLHVIFRGW